MFKLPRVEMTQLVVFILILVIAGIAAMIGLNINNNIGDTLASCNTGFSYDSDLDLCLNATNATQTHDRVSPANLEWNASVDTSTGISNLTAQFPNIGLVVAAVVIIGLLITGFAFAFRGGGGF